MKFPDLKGVNLSFFLSLSLFFFLKSDQTALRTYLTANVSLINCIAANETILKNPPCTF